MFEEDNDFTYIAYELCDYTLQEWLSKDDLHHSEEWGPTALVLIKDLLCSLAYLHSRDPKILHRDIKVCFYMSLKTTITYFRGVIFQQSNS